MDYHSNFGLKNNQTTHIVNRVKQALFQVILLLTNYDESKLLFNMLLIIIQYLQVSYLLFSVNIWQVWKNEIISENIYKFLKYFFIASWSSLTNYSTLIALFYGSLGLFLFSILLLIYVGMNINKKRIEHSWIVSILRILINLFITILGMPLINLCISIIGCKYNSNQYVNTLFQNEICWQNSHILHSIVAIISLLLITFFIIIFSLLYFESKYCPQLVISQQNGRSLAILFLYYLILSLFQELLNNEQYQYIQIIIHLFGSLLLFEKFHIQSPYNHQQIQKCWSILVTLNMWGSLMLCCSKLLEERIFNGIIYAYFVGIPLLTISIIRQQKINYELLLINHSKVTNVQDIINQTNYLIQLLHNINIESPVLIDGYLEIHRATCAREDCYLKIKNIQSINNPLLKDHKLSEREADLIFVLGQIYYNQIKRFPTSTILRIKYSYLLSDQMRQLQQALNELTQAEQMNPQLDEEFIILKKKQLIQEQLDTYQNENFGKIDVASEVTFSNNYRQMAHNIELATLAHMDFWSFLQDESPDLGKMYKLGQKIRNLLSTIEIIWLKIQKANHNLSKAMRLYGNFIIEVLQDEEIGEEMLKKAEIFQQQIQQSKKQIIQFIAGEDIGYEQQATVIVSTQVEKFAIVQNINQSCCHIIGYTRQEIINRKINIFIPNLYIKFHDEYITKFLQTSDTRNINKDRLIFIKDRQNYVTPCFIVLRILHTIDENVNLAAQFLLVKTFRPTCYFLLDEHYNFDSMQSTAICLFGLEHRSIQNKQICIDQLFPDFFDYQEIFMTKQGGRIKYDANSIRGKTGISVSTTINTHDSEFQCIMREILNIHTKEIVGYYVRLELIENDISASKDLKVQQKTQNVNLQFKYIINQKTFQGEYVDEINSRLSQTVLWDQIDYSSIVSSQEKDVSRQQSPIRRQTIKFQEQNKPIVKYDENIRIMRLIDNKIQDVDDKEDDISDGEERESVFESIKNNNIQQDTQQSDNNAFRTRRNFENIIINKQLPKVIVRVTWVSNFIMIVLIVLSFIDYFLSNNLYDEVFSAIQIVRDGNYRNSELMIILSGIFNLQLLNKGVFNYNSSYKIQYEQNQRNYINESMWLVSELNQQIMDEINSLTSDSYNFEFYLDHVQMRLQEGLYEYYDLSEAIQQILSKVVSLRDKDLNNFLQNDTDIYFIEYNLLNGLQTSLKQSSNFYITNLESKSSEKIQIFLIIMIISLCLINSGLSLLIIALLSVSQTQFEIVSLFLDIPDKTIRYLYHKSENFLSNLQIGEDEEVVSEIDELDKDESKELQKTLRSKRTKKNYKNTSKEYRMFIQIIFVILLVIQCYFILTYLLSRNMLNNINQLSPEFNLTARSEFFYRLSELCQRSLFYNRNLNISNQDPYQIILDNLDELYHHDAYLQQYHSLNGDILSQQYSDTYNNLFIKNPCDVINDEIINYDSCNNLMDSAFSQGLSVGIARYFEDQRYIKTIYDQFYQQPKANFTLLARGFGVFRNITQDNDNSTNFILNLNNFLQCNETREVQHLYFKNSFHLLINSFVNGIELELNTLKTQKLAIFVVFEALLIIIYLILWLPLLMKMTKDIWNTRSMILMIPLKVIQKIRTIKEYIRNNIQQIDDKI